MEWLPVLREVHLIGGGRAFNGMDPKVEIRPNTVAGKSAVVTLKSFTGLYSDIKSLGLQAIGCDFFTSREAAESHTPPEWRTKNAEGPTWLCTEQGDQWSFIAHAAFKRKEGYICDLASRVSHQIRACEWRVRQLSEAYAEQLTSRLRSKAFEDGQRFLNGYTPLCYLALQSFLVDACVLRDYLAEFYSATIDPKPSLSDISGTSKVTTLSGLLKRWKAMSPSDAIGEQILASAKPGEWLYELGAYRDLVVHTAPLASAGRKLYAVTHSITLFGEERLPAIKLPLPNNPAALRSERSTGRYFQDPNLTFARFENIIEDVDSTTDALEYAHRCMQLLGTLARTLSEISPVPPEIPVITRDDVMEFIKIE